MADFALSFHDLMLIDGFKDAVDSQNKKVFDIILYDNGIDTSIGYDIVACTHRVLPRRGESEGKLYTGFRVEGEERIDEDWLNSGCASLEAKIAGCKDPELRKELRKMSYQGATSIESQYKSKE